MSEENEVPNTPENGSSEEEVSIPELDEFVFRPDEYTDYIVPRRLVPLDVAKWLVQKIDKETKLEAFVQVERVARFYDPSEIVGTYRGFLSKSESNSEELIRSIVITRIIALLGEEKDLNFARAYYEYLIPKVDSIEEFEEIILLHEGLNLGSDSKSLRGAIKTKIESLAGTDSQSKLKRTKLEQHIDLKLRQAEEIHPIKEKILENTDRKARLVEEIKLYLFNPYGVPELIDSWVARRLRQETWADHPAKQTKRVDRQPLKRNVAIALRDFLTDLDTYKTMKRQERDAAKLRLLRAILFFEGQVTEEEAHFVKGFEGKQIDILANSGYLIEGV